MSSSLSSDVVIVGAGMAGLTLAISLARQGLEVTVLEKADVELFKHQKPSVDGRSSAIAYASQQVLARFGIWDSLASDASPIYDIQVTDGNSPFYLHFDHKQVGDAPMGYMLENNAILRGLFVEAGTLPNITILSPVSAISLQQLPHKAILMLNNGNTVEAKLVVAADGKKSAIRQMLHITTTGWDYNQTAIVCTISHEKDHGCVAQERFLPGGPFAVLPLKGGKHSSLVWVEKTELVPAFMKLSEAERCWHIQKRVGNKLGKIELVTPCISYPLSVCFANQYYRERTVLVGDAAHAVHPIAGQGFNLGIQDIAALVDAVIYNKQLGLDIGAQNMLKRYTTQRRPENMAMIAITDSLTRLFSTNISPIKYARQMGIGIVDHIAPLQRFFIRYAMGLRKS